MIYYDKILLGGQFCLLPSTKSTNCLSFQQTTPNMLLKFVMTVSSYIFTTAKRVSRIMILRLTIVAFLPICLMWERVIRLTTILSSSRFTEAAISAQLRLNCVLRRGIAVQALFTRATKSFREEKLLRESPVQERRKVPKPLLFIWPTRLPVAF